MVKYESKFVKKEDLLVEKIFLRFEIWWKMEYPDIGG